MENKYYIPEISEFHDGFNYEFYIAGSNTEYEPKTFTLLDSLMIKGIYQRELEEGWLRVKYLDQTDIEECCWKKHTEYPNCFINYNYFFNVIGNNVYVIQPKDLALHQDKIDCALTSAILFQGTIKNKSELKKVMNMLMIK
jgi:hypothetical protein